MKIRLYLKDPDGVAQSVQDAVEEHVRELGLSSQQEEDSATEEVTEEFWEELAPWVEFQEYVIVDIDTDTGETGVVKIG